MAKGFLWAHPVQEAQTGETHEDKKAPATSLPSFQNYFRMRLWTGGREAWERIQTLPVLEWYI